MAWLPIVWAWSGCTPKPPDEPGPTKPAPTTSTTIPVAPFVPLISGGEVVFTLGGQLLVSAAPPGATVELYRGTRQGPGPCHFDVDPPAGPCFGMTDPTYIATGTADANGEAPFVLDTDYDEPQAIVWQAKVIDPVDSRLVAFTDAIARHVSVHPNFSPVTFVKSTRQAGLLDTFTVGNTHTGGVAFVDVNNDYLPDIYILSGMGVRNRLYVNQGAGMFVEESDRMQKPGSTIECAGVTFADIENDGDLDVMIPVDNPATMVTSEPQPNEGGPNLLFVNDGTGWFTEQAAAAGVLDPRGWRNSNASFQDYDRDGCIDLYLLQWAMAAPPGENNVDVLLRGDCDGTFTDVSEQFGLDPHGRDGLGMLWWDADFDLYPELYVANNSDRDEPPVFDPLHDYWKNLGGASFADWTHHADPTTGADGWAGMGMDVGDIEGDGDWDLYITDVWQLPPVPKGNVLYLGEPDGSLGANACQEKGLCFGYNSWPANFMDFDNDGWVDLWVGASLPSDPDMLYINRADGSGMFYPTRVEGWSGYIGRGGTAADYDADGDVDVFLWVEGNDSSLWENTLQSDHHWLELRLLGTRSNRAAIGARIEVRNAGSPTLLRKVSGGDSAHSQTDLTVHVGLGDHAVAEHVDVFWPSGEVQRFTDVATDRFWLVDEDAGLVDEVLTDATAVWDAAESTLTVGVRSSYVGRSRIRVDGIGDLAYLVADRPEDASYLATFAAETRPDEVLVVSTNGATATVPVVDAAGE